MTDLVVIRLMLALVWDWRQATINQRVDFDRKSQSRKRPDINPNPNPSPDILIEVLSPTVTVIVTKSTRSDQGAFEETKRFLLRLLLNLTLSVVCS